MDFSLKEIVDENGKSYGIGVVLDSTLLDNLTPEERVVMVKEYVKEIGGNEFDAYDENGKTVKIRVAKEDEKFRNRKGKKVPVNKDLTGYLDYNLTKQEAITLIDELVISAKKPTRKRQEVHTVGSIITERMIGIIGKHIFRIKITPFGKQH